MPRSLRGSVSIRDWASQLTLRVWSMYHDMPVQQQWCMEETVRIQKTEAVVGTVRMQQQGVLGNRRPDIVGDHTHVACLLLSFVIFLHCSSSTSR